MKFCARRAISKFPMAIFSTWVLFSLHARQIREKKGIATVSDYSAKFERCFEQIFAVSRCGLAWLDGVFFS